MRKLLIMFLGILIVITLAGCGGGGGGGSDDTPKGETMSQDQLASRFEEANNVGDAVSTAISCVSSAMGASGVTGKIGVQSQTVRAAGDTALSWSGPDNDGWYTAAESGEGYSDNYKMRYIAKTKTIEMENSWTYTDNGKTETEKEYIKASIVAEGSYTGYITHTSSDGTLQKAEFTALTQTGCTGFTVWVNDKKMISISFTISGSQMTMSGSVFDKSGNETKLENKVVTIPEGPKDGDENSPGSPSEGSGGPGGSQTPPQQGEGQSESGGPGGEESQPGTS